MNKQLVYAVLGILILSMFGGMASSQYDIKEVRAVPAAR